MGAKAPRLFLDANVLFSAAYDPEGRSALLVELAQQGKGALLSSPYAVEEARRNLESKRPAALARLQQLLRSVQVVKESSSEEVRRAAVRYGVHAADAPILAAALRSGAGVLVTGDRAHFGHLMERHPAGLSTRVISLAEALRLLHP